MKYSETKAAELTGLSRVSIQRYRNAIGTNGNKVLDPIYEQKAGLKYFYYNEIEMEKLWLIRIFQSLDKSSEEIIKIMTESEITKLKHLSDAIDELEKLINVAKQYVNTGISHRVIKEVIYNDKEVSYEELDSLLLLISNSMSKEVQLLENKIVNNKRLKILIDTIINYYYEEIPFVDMRVQSVIRHISHELFSCKYYSLDALCSILMPLLGEINLNGTSKNICAYLFNAVKYYKNHHNCLNKEYCIDDIFDTIVKLSIKGYKKDSDVIFNQILKYAIFLNSLYDNKEYVLYKLDIIGKHISNKAVIKDEKNNKYHNFIYESIKNFIMKVQKESINLIENEYNDDYDGLICPYCDEPLIFNHFTNKWECELCNHIYTEESLTESKVYWFCDECGAYLNDQLNYYENSNRHICSECGYVNNLSEDKIIDKDAYE